MQWLCVACSVAQGQETPSGAPSPPGYVTLPVRYAEWTVPNPEDPVNGGYTAKGELRRLNVSLSAGGDRDFFYEYDEFGRSTTDEVTSTETGSAIVRGFDYTYYDQSGSFTRTGPDGVYTNVQKDAAGRVGSVQRWSTSFPLVQANYAYKLNGGLESVTYSNGTSTWYTYDAAGRVTAIDHRGIMGISMLKLEYDYLDNDLVSQIKERDATQTVVATTDFGYDARGRLTSEKRSPNGPTGPSYDLEYEYDQGGNRVKKTQHILRGFSRVEEVYAYWNNRLVSYTTTSFVPASPPAMGAMMMAPGGPPGGGTVETLLSDTWYGYNLAGNVTSVTTHSWTAGSNEPDKTRTRLEYAANGRTVTFVLGKTWGNGQPEDITYAREFRYDGARQRYLTRVLNADALEGGQFTVDAEIWSDYDGDEIYGEFTVHQDGADPPEARQERSFVMGMATVGWTDNPRGERVPNDPSLRYYHADMIGTTRFMTDYRGDPGEEAVFTAFGERIDGAPRRFGYAGAWGYQSTMDDGTPPAEVFPFLHVGARYYDPATGRFLQRDPIGILGGANVYAYVDGRPTSSVDPEGLYNDPSGQLAGCGFGGPCRPAEPTPEPISWSPEELQRKLELERQLQAFCYGGLLVVGGWEAAATKSIIGGTLVVGGALAWVWEYAMG